MNLKYRGVVYSANVANVALTEKQLIGKYRGQDCYRVICETQLAQSSPILKYRGVFYGDASPSSNFASAASDRHFKIEVPQHQKPVKSSREQPMTELDRVHNDFLLKKLEQRLSSAQKNGDLSLLEMLEKERNDLA